VFGTNATLASTTLTGRTKLTNATTTSLSITGRLFDNTSSAGTNGMVLKSTGSGFAWVATSTLGLTGLTAASIDTSAELAAILTDETGSGRSVFSASPAFSGTATFAALTATGTLTVANNINISDTNKGYQIGGNRILYASSTNSSTLVGSGAGAALLTSGIYNTVLGYQALSTATSSSNNTAVGFQALQFNRGGGENSAYGTQSLNNNTTGTQNTAIGFNSLRYNTTGYANTANGSYTLVYNTTGISNTASGYGSLFSNTTGDFNTALGKDAGHYLTDGSSAASTTDYSLFLGYNTKALTSNDQNSIVIGYNANGLGSNTVVLGNDSITTTALKGNVGIGTTTPSRKLTVAGTSFFGNTITASAINATGTLTVSNNINISDTTKGYQIGSARILYASSSNKSTLVGSGAGVALKSTGFSNVALGYDALLTATTSSSNTAVGAESLKFNRGGVSNVATGFQSLFSNTAGSYNTAVGSGALFSNTRGARNTAQGYQSLSSNIGGSSNTAFGESSLDNNITGSYNTAIGMNAGIDLNTASSTGFNTFIGFYAGGGITTGVNNTILGAQVTGLAATLSNNIIIADGAGNQRINVGATGNVGIGTSTPTNKLTVAGTSNFTGNLTLSSSSANIVLGSNYLSGDGGDEGLTVGPLGQVMIDYAGATYDLWLQGATTTIAGDTRNLALMGNSTNDDLILNVNTEYDCVSVGGLSCTAALDVTGTGQFSGNLTLSGSTANLAIGSNYVSGDGDDEGLIIEVDGDVLMSKDLSIVGTGFANSFAANSITGGTISSFAVARDGSLVVNQVATSTSGSDITVNVSGDQSVASTGGLYALYAVPTFSGTTGTQGTLAGVWSVPSLTSTGSTTSMYGGLFQPTKTGTGRVVNMYGLYSRAVNSNASGVVTNAYGLYIADSSETGVITNDFGVYQVDTGADNYFGGNVGIGSTTPGTKLSVNGNINITLSTTGTTNNAVCWDNAGSTLLYDCDATPADYAESYPTENNVAFGHIVMTTDTVVTTKIGTKVSKLAKAQKGASFVMGVTSDNFHDFTSAGKEEVASSHHPLPVALVGRVPVKVNLEGGDIAVGDSITVSSVAGVGTKATSTGSYTIGTALEPYTENDLEGGKDSVLVFVQNAIYNSPQDQIRASLFASALSDATEADIFTALLEDQTDTVWSRITKLAQGFVDGVLTVAGLKTDELCIGNTCVNEAQLIQVLDAINNPPATNTGGGSSSGGSGGSTGDGGGAGGDAGTTTPPTPPQDPPPSDPPPQDPVPPTP
jgi:hypothetical protein